MRLSLRNPRALRGVSGDARLRHVDQTNLEVPSSDLVLTGASLWAGGGSDSRAC